MKFKESFIKLRTALGFIIQAYVKNNVQSKIQLSEVASLVGLTEVSFCRYFKKVHNKTFVTFLNEFRIALAIIDRKRPYGFGNWLSMRIQQHQFVSPIVHSFHQIDAFGISE